MEIGDKVTIKKKTLKKLPASFENLGVGTVLDIREGPWPIVVRFGTNHGNATKRSFSYDELNRVGKPMQEESPDKPVAYISGPMSGKPDNNFPRFYEVEEIVQDMGYAVINPARMDEEDGADKRLHDPEDDFWYKDLLKRDLDEILGHADIVITFDDWTNSRGATNEAYVADVVGIDIKFLNLDGDEPQLDDVRQPVPFEAKEIVLGARRYDYGHPYENFLRIARLWDSWLQPKLVDGAEIDHRDVAMMMILLKMAREQNAPKPDNLVDIVGYAYAYDESNREIKRRGGDLDDLLSDGLSLMRENSVDSAFE